MVLKTAGKQAGQLLDKINAIWSQVVAGVDEIILASVAEFIHDSALLGYPEKDHWQDRNGGDRTGFIVLDETSYRVCSSWSHCSFGVTHLLMFPLARLQNL